MSADAGPEIFTENSARYRRKSNGTFSASSRDGCNRYNYRFIKFFDIHIIIPQH
jgi:hypothetical protein